VHIRQAVAADAGPISLLVTELGYPTSLEAMQTRLASIFADPSHATFVAERDSNVVGVAGAALDWYYEEDGQYCRLLVLAVTSPARGTGIGRRLIATIERWAIGKGAREVFLNSGIHRHDAHEFYERCGYARTGFRFVRQLDLDDAS
jgi:GNAT superfamily N-acetyltransferase